LETEGLLEKLFLCSSSALLNTLPVAFLKATSVRVFVLPAFPPMVKQLSKVGKELQISGVIGLECSQ